MRHLLAAITATLTLTFGAATSYAQTAVNATTAQMTLIDINRASPDELKTLKGIGEVRAAAIVKGRPYARKDDLVRRGIIPESVYGEIREQIIARQ